MTSLRLLSNYDQYWLYGQLVVLAPAQLLGQCCNLIKYTVAKVELDVSHKSTRFVDRRFRSYSGANKV